MRRILCQLTTLIGVRAQGPSEDRVIRSWPYDDPKGHERLQACPQQGTSIDHESHVPRFEMTEGIGGAHLGNQVMAVRSAMALTACCGGVVRLPEANFNNLEGVTTAAEFDFSADLIPTRAGYTTDRQADCLEAAAQLHGLWDWFHLGAIPSWLQQCTIFIVPFIECEKRYFGGLLQNTGCDSLSGDPDELIIHLRSGDIWETTPHARYGQPPFAFYEAVLQHHDWSAVTIVTDTSVPELTHPFAGMLQQLLPDLVHVYKSESLAGDLKKMLCARNLVTARSTLASLLLWFGPHLHKVFVESETAPLPGTWLSHLGKHSDLPCENPSTMLPQMSSVLQDTTFYVLPRGPQYRLYDTWANTQSDRLIMLSQWPADSDGKIQLQRC